MQPSSELSASSVVCRKSALASALFGEPVAPACSGICKGSYELLPDRSFRQVWPPDLTCQPLLGAVLEHVRDKLNCLTVYPDKRVIESCGIHCDVGKSELCYELADWNFLETTELLTL